MDVKTRLFGAGHRIFTAVGVVAGLLVALGQYLALVPPAYQTSKWYAVAAALVALGAALKMPAKPSVPTAPTALALIIGALLFAAPARAQDLPPVPPAQPVAIFGFYPTLGFTGSAFDFAHNAGPVRSAQIGALLEREVWKDTLGLAIGLQAQTGDVRGINATGLLTFPVLVPKGCKVIPAAGMTGAIILNDKSTYSAVVGTLMRF